MTDVDVAELETAEDTLERVVYELERAVAYGVDSGDPDGLKAQDLADLVEDLHDVLDCVQMVLGRPYVWLLSRSS